MSELELRAENAELRARLDDAEETLRAIRGGMVDAIVVGGTDDSRRVYTLDGADRAYRVWVEQMSQGAATLHPDGTVAYCNPRLAALLGTTFPTLVGLPLRRLVVPEDREQYDALFLACSEGAGHGEVNLVGPSGSSVPILMTVNPLPRGSGAAVGVLVTDLTPQRRHDKLTATLAALKENEERLRLATDAAELGIWAWHLADDCITWENDRPYEIFGLPPTEKCPEAARFARDHVHPDDAAEFQEALRSTARTGGRFRFQGRFRRGDGRLRWVELTGRLQESSDGSPARVLGTAADVTDRKSAEEENARLFESLREQDVRRNEFLATLAHELRNPLAPIGYALAVLKMGKTVDADALHRMMERQLGQMVHLVDDLLDVSRVTTGKIKLKFERLDARRIVEAAIETSRPIVQQGGHLLEVQLPDQPLPLEGDATRLVQVLTNLLNNAAKYTPKEGRISLDVRREGGRAVIRVTDTGIGIPPEMISRVFDLFTQVGDTLDRSQGGLGIGLTLVRRLVEMHGGTVTAESAGLKRGSSFVVSLPLAMEPPPPTPVPAAKMDEASHVRRILVVDDNVDGATGLALLLSLAGHATEVAHDGPTAIEAAMKFRPDVMFLDIGLPGMHGYEVASRLRADASFGGMVLVALTGWGSAEDRDRSKQVGFDFHLTKPVESSRLEALLSQIADSRPGSGGRDA